MFALKKAYFCKPIAIQADLIARKSAVRNHLVLENLLV